MGIVKIAVSGTQTLTYTQAWNAENRLSVVTNTASGEVTRFVYNGNGNRVLREDADGLTAYVGAIEVRISATERVTTSYYFVGSQRIAMRRGSEVTYLHGDHGFCKRALSHPFRTGVTVDRRKLLLCSALQRLK